jgi:hypothetical protein
VEFVKGECFNADDPLSTLNVIIFGLVSKQGQPWLGCLLLACRHLKRH